ncbi:MAG: outer membrane beta-barrel protein [Bacteroidota bacterium]
MSKKLVALIGFFLFIFLPFHLFSQDQVILKTGDTLKCQILKIDDNALYVRYLQKGHVESQLIKLSEVEKYQHLFPGNEKVNTSLFPKKKYPWLMLGAGGGYSYRIAKLPANTGQYTQYYKNLKSGFNILGEAGYFWGRGLGLGVKYNFFRAKSYQEGVVVILNSGPKDTVNMGDDTRVSYIGPVLYGRMYNRAETIVWLFSLSIGYEMYYDKAQLSPLYSDFYIKGSTFGMSVGIGADFLVAKHLAVGVLCSLETGILSTVTTNIGGNVKTITFSNDQKENLSKVNLSLLVKFWK